MTPSVRTLQGGAKTKSFKGSSSLALGGQTRVAFPLSFILSYINVLTIMLKCLVALISILTFDI